MKAGKITQHQYSHSQMPMTLLHLPYTNKRIMNNYKNKQWLSVATIILLLANIVTLALLWGNKATGKADGRKESNGQVFEFLTKELQLNTQQQDAYQKLREQHRVSQRMIHDSIRKAKDIFYELIQQPAIADSAIHLYSKKATDLISEMDVLTFKHFQQVRALCTPVQQKKFDSIIKDVLRRMNAPRPGPPGKQGEGPGNMLPPPGDAQDALPAAP
jgi:periplasmic protein CpxP/Spy